MRIGDIPVGDGAPLVLVAGVNVVEFEETTLAVAHQLREIAARHDFPVVFKASVDKANRSSLQSYRGLGFDEGLRVLARTNTETEMPVLTDVHEPGQAKPAAEVADCLQVPAFLSRQTDLVIACAATGKPVNIKKGQFMAPLDVRHAVEKVAAYGEGGALVSERGTTFGYDDLVVDMRGLVQMRQFAPVCFDATHSVQRRRPGEASSNGDRSMVMPLARAAVAVGLDAIFVEVHPEPETAPCDGPSQLGYQDFERLLAEVRSIDRALAQSRSEGRAGSRGTSL